MVYKNPVNENCSHNRVWHHMHDMENGKSKMECFEILSLEEGENFSKWVHFLSQQKYYMVWCKCTCNENYYNINYSPYRASGMKNIRILWWE